MPYEEVPEEFNRVLCDFLLHDAPRRTSHLTIAPAEHGIQQRLAEAQPQRFSSVRQAAHRARNRGRMSSSSRSGSPAATCFPLR